MGCFDFNCCLSGLGVSAGETVRYLLLAENPYEDFTRVMPWDFYYPRTLPIRGKYDNYGGIEDYDPASPAVASLERGFDEDVIEMGTGDNYIHDGAVRPGLKFKEWHDVVSSGRVHVKRDYDPSSEPSSKIPDGQPTLGKIKDLLVQAGYTVVEGGRKSYKECSVSNKYGFLVDEVLPGWVRVRFHAMCDEVFSKDIEYLETALKAVQTHYAAVITAGARQEPELQIMPQPGEMSYWNRKHDKGARVEFGMIKSRVWNAIMNEPCYGYKEMLKHTKEAWDRAVKRYRPETPIPEELFGLAPELRDLLENMRERESNLSMNWHIGRSDIPYTMGVSEHFNLAARLHGENPFTAKQIKTFLEDVAGLNVIRNMIYSIRYSWRPSTGVGPQCVETAAHRRWAGLVAKVAGVPVVIPPK